MIQRSSSGSRSDVAKRFGIKTYSCRLYFTKTVRLGDELDYQRHILSGIEWTAIESPDPQSSLPEHARWQWATVDVGEALPVFHADRELYIDKTVRLSWYARRLADLIPNPWQASRISRQFVDKLRGGGAVRR